MIEFNLTEKQFVELLDIVDVYRDLQNELYDNPPEDTLFTKTQLEMFSMMEEIYNSTFEKV